ncbi:MAG: hypothetical protein IKI94_01540 [Ruminococcus sp.]|nr:hypothetical protein [Ruminococcus sp.]
MAYTVIRTDLLSGTDVAADLVSLRVYDADGNPIAVENGTIVELQGYEDGQREVMKAVLATSASKIEDCAIVATEEVMYDERKKNLDEFINEAGTIARGYIPRSRNMYSITKDGFVGGTVPAKGDEVGIGADGKVDAAGTGYGTIMAVEIAGRYTYYVIKIA